MDIKTIGEFELINQFAKKLSHNLGQDVVGIGDDCSIVPIDEESFQLTTTDLLIENVHFFREKITPHQLGEKSLAVNISDIAAMGGIPQNIYLSIGLPENLETKYIEQFFNGFHQSCEKFNLKLLGGDTTKSPGPIIINVLLQGTVKRINVKKRSQAVDGDIICVTGDLGDSGIGLGLLLNNWTTKNDPYFISKHHCPLPHLEEGQWLSQFSSVHAMIDISDGIASDIKHICTLSKVGATIHLDQIPHSNEAKVLFDENPKVNKREILLSSGEDYCLLSTISKNDFQDIADKFKDKFAKDLTPVGAINNSGEVLFQQDRKTITESIEGFDHFKGRQ